MIMRKKFMTILDVIWLLFNLEKKQEKIYKNINKVCTVISCV